MKINKEIMVSLIQDAKDIDAKQRGIMKNLNHENQQLLDLNNKLVKDRDDMLA